MKTKEMLIIEVSKEFKEELDKLDTVAETRSWFNGLEIGKDVFTELCEAQRELQFEYVTQVLMYLVSTRNYIEKPELIFYVMYGLNSASYYVTKISLVKDKNVYIASYNNEEEAKKHAKKLNEFLEENK